MAKTSKAVARTRRTDPEKAQAALRRLREMSDLYGGPTKGMTKNQVVALVKKTREELWDQYLASRPRR